jgi:predicted Zn-dependent protease
MEADQLGVQYAWKAGYDPYGFVTFFDKMASDKGHVKTTSFFRTHPPFFDRIVKTFSEVAYLPQDKDLAIDTKGFWDAKDRVEVWSAKRRAEELERPSLLKPPGCSRIGKPVS